MDEYEIIIGLEIHVQLETKSKMFGPERCSFDQEPNRNIGLVDTGQPGSLPTINKEALRKAIQFGLATKAEIKEDSAFDRKSYFYPDSPLSYQITQFYHPIVVGGEISCDIEGRLKTFTIEHAHLENDAGMLKHFGNFSGVDYNRAGSPLLEIVSNPCMHSAKEASAYAKEIKKIMEFIGAAKCNMEEGGMRMDVNISLRKRGETKLRPKVEIKNMNSFFYMEQAIAAEVKRQKAFYDSNPDKLIQSGTFRFDIESQQTIMMRTKERAQDYRYFPDPDLPPVKVSKSLIAELEKTLPELPRDKEKRFCKELNLSPYFAELLINDRILCQKFEEAQKECSNAPSLCNWLAVEFAGRLKEKNLTFATLPINPLYIAKLVNLLDKKTITGKIAKAIADKMLEPPYLSPEKLIAANPDFQPLESEDLIEKCVNLVLEKNQQSINDYLAGKEKAFQYLVGMVMKETKGKARPDLVHNLLKEKINQNSKK